jgi:hypothetical protein
MKHLQALPPIENHTVVIMTFYSLLFNNSEAEFCFKRKSTTFLPPTMPLVVRLATRTDIPSMVDICERAFLNDPIFKYMYPETTPADKYAFRTRMFEEEWSLPGRNCFVLADTDVESVISFVFSITENLKRSTFSESFHYSDKWFMF